MEENRHNLNERPRYAYYAYALPRPGSIANDCGTAVKGQNRSTLRVLTNPLRIGGKRRL